MRVWRTKTTIELCPECGYVHSPPNRPRAPRRAQRSTQPDRIASARAAAGAWCVVVRIENQPVGGDGSGRGRVRRLRA
jgi:hypothetical protein